MSDTQGCVYCGSTSYGRPCVYSPTKVHLHVNNGGKCVYCGSTSKGSRCIYNPYGKYHIMGYDYSTSIKESVEKTVLLKYLTEKVLSTKNISTPLNRFYVRLWESYKRNMIPLLETLGIQTRITESVETPQEIEEVFQFRQDLKKNLKDLKETFQKYNHHKPEFIEQAILDTIIDSCDERELYGN